MLKLRGPQGSPWYRQYSSISSSWCPSRSSSSFILGWDSKGGGRKFLKSKIRDSHGGSLPALSPPSPSRARSASFAAGETCKLGESGSFSSSPSHLPDVNMSVFFMRRGSSRFWLQMVTAGKTSRLAYTMCALVYMGEESRYRTLLEDQAKNRATAAKNARSHATLRGYEPLRKMCRKPCRVVCFRKSFPASVREPGLGLDPEDGHIFGKRRCAHSTWVPPWSG